MRWLFSKNREKDGVEGYEEISEKRTSILGYILLLFMSIALIWAGELAFGDITDLISRPMYPSTCLSNGVVGLESVSVNEGLYSRSGCALSGFTEAQSEAKRLVQENMDQLIKLESLQSSIKQEESSIKRVKSKNSAYRDEYETGLLENIAGQEGVIDDEALQNSLSSGQIAIQSSQNRLVVLERQEAALQLQLSPMATRMEQLYTGVYNQYKIDIAWYKFKIVGVQLLFILPLFFLALSRYFVLKRKDSPYTIIATSALSALGFLLLQVVGLFIWEIIPKGLLEEIFQFFREIAILRYVLYYAFIGLVIASFGGIVYVIQKRVFNSRAVAVRRIKDKKCPGCSFPLDVHYDIFCGKCGLQVLETCPSCQKMKVRYLDHCSQCGAFGNNTHSQV